MSRELRIRFRNVREIRMGSPYNLCDISFQGDWIPPLQSYDWQNIKAVSPDKKHIALVLWNVAGNVPGFHVIRIDVERKTYHKTKRIMGLCKRIFWDCDKFKWERDNYQ